MSGLKEIRLTDSFQEERVIVKVVLNEDDIA
jgi:hypothetical protein